MCALYKAEAPRFELARGHAGYPQHLEDLKNPPRRLYGIGDAGCLVPGIAVVGARKATPYGRQCAEIFSSRIAQCGVVIVSGGAIGCDQEALWAAVNAGKPCVFVAGGGADYIYPSNARALIDAILECGGAVISEQRWGFEPRRGTFVARNRIIAGLSRAVFVVEAGLPSGTFHTAGDALEMGREVLAVPGCIHSPQSAGANQLICDGAVPIVDIKSLDVALTRLFGLLPGLMGPSVGSLASRKLSASQRKLVSNLRARPERIEQIAAAMRGKTKDISQLVTECEMMGLLARYPDGRYGAVVDITQ